MNEEERWALEYFKSVKVGDNFDIQKELKCREVISGILLKQQKEIENRLNEIKCLYNFISIREERIDELVEINEKYNDLYISKDKIKEKIEEITSYAYTSAAERDCQDYAIQVLKELLGE